jgi:ATP-dependent DNA ligase
MLEPKPGKAKSKAATVRFVEPMYAQLVQQLPEGKDWLYEVKFDGYRCLAGKDAVGVTLWSRRGNDLTAQFPNIAKACEQLPARTLLDGERSHQRERAHLIQLASTSSLASTSTVVLCFRCIEPPRDQFSQ